MADNGGIRKSKEWFRISYAAGLAPMTLRLAVEGIGFTVGQSSGQTVIHVPLTTAAHIWVTGAENDANSHIDDLRWHVCLYDTSDEDEEDVLGDSVTTEGAVDLIATQLNKVTAIDMAERHAP